MTKTVADFNYINAFRNQKCCRGMPGPMEVDIRKFPAILSIVRSDDLVKFLSDRIRVDRLA